MMAESFARSFELPVYILHPFNTFGLRQSERTLVPMAVRQLLDPTCRGIRVGDVSTMRDFAFVTDTVAAFLAMGTAPGIATGTAYNAGTGTAISVGDLIGLAAKVTGYNKLVEQDTRRMRPPRSEVHALLADSSWLTAATGWEARHDLFTKAWRIRPHGGVGGWGPTG